MKERRSRPDADEDHIRVGRVWMRAREYRNLDSINAASRFPCENGAGCPHREDNYPCKDCERDVFAAITGGSHG